MTPYVYQTVTYLLGVTLFAILSESLHLTSTYAKNIALSAVMAIVTGIMLYVTVRRLPYPFIHSSFHLLSLLVFVYCIRVPARYIKIWDNCIRAAMYASLFWFAVSLNETKKDRKDNTNSYF